MQSEKLSFSHRSFFHLDFLPSLHPSFKTGTLIYIYNSTDMQNGKEKTFVLSDPYFPKIMQKNNFDRALKKCNFVNSNESPIMLLKVLI